MLRIIVETTHLVISQYAHDVTNMVEYTHPLTRRLWVNMHIPSRWSRGKKKRLHGVSPKEDGRLREQIQHFFFFSISINLSAVCRSNSAWNEDLVRTCRDTKCLSANKHTDQSILCMCHCYCNFVFMHICFKHWFTLWCYCVAMMYVTDNLILATLQYQCECAYILLHVLYCIIIPTFYCVGIH